MVILPIKCPNKNLEKEKLKSAIAKQNANTKQPQ